MEQDSMSRDTFIAWLKKQPRKKEYCYAAHGKCLVARYFKASGYTDVLVYSGGHFEHSGGRHDKYPEMFDEVAIMTPHTYGAALARAETF